MLKLGASEHPIEKTTNASNPTISKVLLLKRTVSTPSKRAEITPTILATVNICPTTPKGNPKVSAMSMRRIPARRLGIHVTKLATTRDQRIRLCKVTSLSICMVSLFVLNMESR
jgi:hypothetical protein